MFSISLNMFEFLVIIMFISHIVIYYILTNNGKIVINLSRLKSIPKKITYVDVDPNYKLVYDIMEAIVLEKWKMNYYEHNHSYIEISFTNKTSNIKLYLYIDGGKLFYISIQTDSETINIENINRKIKKDFTIFAWHHILKYHESQNIEKTKYYKSFINNINNNLKMLKRSKTLDNILNEK